MDVIVEVINPNNGYKLLIEVTRFCLLFKIDRFIANTLIETKIRKMVIYGEPT